MLSRILIFGLLVSNLFGNDRWSSNIDYKEVIAKAQSGSAYFQGLLGIYLRSGESGCMVDAELSRQWSEVSSKQGHPFGTYNLANLAILNGDFEKATNLYQDAALLLQRKASDGDPVAMYCMGEIDFQVIPTNVPRALDWFKKSAEMGYPQAQATVGALYLKGFTMVYWKRMKKREFNYYLRLSFRNLLRLDTILVWHIIMAMECSKIWKRQYSGCELQKNKIFLRHNTHWV